MSSVTVNVTTSAGTQTPYTQSTTDDAIKLEARRRLMETQAKERAETEAALRKVQREKEVAESRVREERIRLLAEEEQVRLKAQRLLIEAEAKRLADEREVAIAVEMERLKTRSQSEILEDKVAELTATIKTLQTQMAEQSRRCL
jgi:hypothetical protein